MTLHLGARLGPYEILAPIGAGGMGEVYKARDTRLDRTVAVKIVRGGIADSEQIARFEREARAIAALEHAHICTLHDVGTHEGTMFLVMEYVTGQTLAERLRKGPLPLDEAMAVGGQIAAALDAAHKHGIVHRDVKPANVMLTRSGVKLLDFGLAKLKAHAPAPIAASVTSMPTAPGPLTERGAIVGTLQYMAPEQLEGHDVDARADVWALGAILYEMVSGTRPFDGANSASIIAAVLEHEPPPLDSLQALTPPMLDRLVRRCLAKDRDARWDSAHDVMLQLNAIGATQADARIAAPRSRRTPAIAALGIGLALAAGFVGGQRFRRDEVRDTAVARLTVTAPAGIVPLASESSVAVSADGRAVAFLGSVRGTTQIFLRRLDRDDATAVEGTSGAMSPFFSPDGRWIGMFQDGKLRKVSIDGGPPQTIADAPSGRGAVWRLDGAIFFAPMQSGPIVQVSADGGTPRPVTTLDQAAGENSHRFPALIDNGRVLLFTARLGGSFENARVVAVRLASGERKTLVHGGLFGRWLPTGYLVFAKGTTLMAAPFDAARLEMLASPTPVLEGVRYNGTGGISDFALSDTGTLVYAPAALYWAPAELARVSRDGTVQPIATDHLPFRDVSIAPNGRVAAVSADHGDDVDLWLVDVTRGTLRPLVRGFRNETPFWTPDGAQIVFSSNRRGPTNIFSLRLDRPDEPRPVFTSREWQFATSLTPDGRGVLYGEVKADTGWDIWTQPLDGATAARKLLGTPAHERYARLSPDGRVMAFVSDESGRNEVYVVSYPQLAVRVQVSSSGGSQPIWARSGRELFYRADDALMSVQVDTAAAPIAVGGATVLFHASFRSMPVYALGYDVMPDDRGFVMIRALTAETTQVNVVLNWCEEVNRSVGAAEKVTRRLVDFD
jgi:eukaryotic-like serine/threonine-protein kinase